MPQDIRPATWDDLVEASARRQQVDPRLARAVMQTESSGRPDAVSPAGARGLFQLMPATAARWNVKPDDPYENIRGGVSELKALLDQHGGDVVQALRR